MGVIAFIGATKLDIDSDRPTLERLLKSGRRRDGTALESEYTLDLFNWRNLYICFSRGDFPNVPIQDIRGGIGIWSIRGRHSLNPEPGQTFRGYSWCYNDWDDVAAISAWMDKGPTFEFMSYFRTEHELLVNKMISEGKSDETIRAQAGGLYHEAPYLWEWDRLQEFYARARMDQYVVTGYVGQ